MNDSLTYCILRLYYSLFLSRDQFYQNVRLNLNEAKINRRKNNMTRNESEINKIDQKDFKFLYIDGFILY